MKHALAIQGALAILAIVAFVALYTPSITGNYMFLSERMCGPGAVSVYRGSPPVYPGGVARQTNVVCYPKGIPVEAEGGPPFPEGRSPIYPFREDIFPFDRLRQDPWSRYYD